MNYEQFSTIYKVLQSASANSSLNQDNVIEAIKGQLSPDSDAYKEWEEGDFSLDHVFTIVNAFRNKSKQTLLTCACQSADLEVVDFLLKAGASVNVAAGDENPFTVAIQKEWDDGKEDAKAIVNLLIGKVDAHVSAADENVNNTIVKAVERGNLRVFKYLVAKGASLEIEAHGMTLLWWAKEHKPDPKIKGEDMDEIIGTIASSEEKKQTDIATSTNIEQTDEAESTIPGITKIKKPVAGISKDEELASRLQMEEIALSTDGQLPEKNGTSSTGTKNVVATPANSNDNKIPEKNDTNFWSEHKGKIALGVTGLCVAGAIAAYMLAYPAVALALTVLAAVILMGAGIAKVLEDPSVEGLSTSKEQGA